MAEKIGIAIIGCGGIAHPHLEAWRASSDLCEVRALADPNPDALHALHAKIPGATAYADYTELLERDDIDASANIPTVWLLWALRQIPYPITFP